MNRTNIMILFILRCPYNYNRTIRHPHNVCRDASENESLNCVFVVCSHNDAIDIPTSAHTDNFVNRAPSFNQNLGVETVFFENIFQFISLFEDFLGKFLLLLPLSFVFYQNLELNCKSKPLVGKFIKSTEDSGITFNKMTLSCDKRKFLTHHDTMKSELLLSLYANKKTLCFLIDKFSGELTGT